MNNEEKILGLLEKIYIDLHDTKQDLRDTKKNFQETNDSLRAEMQKGFEAVNLELQEVKNAIVRIENDHGQKLSALFDGYKQNSDKLDRIEVEVAKHEEIILRRVR